MPSSGQPLAPALARPALTVPSSKQRLPYHASHCATFLKCPVVAQCTASACPALPCPCSPAAVPTSHPRRILLPLLPRPPSAPPQARKKVEAHGWTNVHVVEGDACEFVPPEGCATLVTFSYSLSSECACYKCTTDVLLRLLGLQPP